MFAKILLLCVLSSIVNGKINVNIKTGNNENEAKVDVLGADIAVISDKERETFKITDSNLKSWVEKHFKNNGESGGKPTDVYVKSPTPWGDKYKGDDALEEVKRILRPVNVKVIGLRTEPTIVAKQTFENNSTKQATYNAGIEQSVEQTTSNSWSKSGEFSFNQEINYSVDFKVASVGGSTSFGFTSGWGEETSKSISSRVGSTSGVNVELGPGQAVLAELTANKGTMEVQVDYEITVTGDVLLNYEKTFLGHHFYNIDVNYLLEAGESKTKFESREILKIGYYSDAKITVRDAEQTDKVLYSGPVPIAPDLSKSTWQAFNGFD